MAISGCTRGISPVTPFTASTTLQFAHTGGTAIIFSDSPSLFNAYAAKANSESITAGWVFASTSSNLPGYISLPSDLSASSTAFASVSFAQNLASQGAATSTESVGGIVELATQIEMASSTDLGANRPLVLQAKYATSTPGTAGLWAVITNNAGKIAQAFLDLTSAYIWTGLNAFNNASTTFNGIEYGFPSVQNASSTVLMKSATGQLSWGKALVVFIQSNQSITKTNSGTTTAATYTIPASTIGTNGFMRYNVYFQSTTTVAAQFAGVSFGNGTATTSVGFVHLNNNTSPLTTPYDASISGTIRNINSASSQSAAGIGIGSGLTTNTKGQYMATSTSYNTAATTYLSIDINAASDNIVTQGFTLEIVP